MKGLLACIILVLCLATFAANQELERPITCADEDGHGPDPGTAECTHAIVFAREHQVERVQAAYTQVVFWGAMVLLIGLIARQAARHPLFRGPGGSTRQLRE